MDKVKKIDMQLYMWKTKIARNLRRINTIYDHSLLAKYEDFYQILTYTYMVSKMVSNYREKSLGSHKSQFSEKKAHA